MGIDENGATALLERYKHVPHELRALRQWVVWRRELRNDEWTKVPYTPKTGDMARTNQPATWGTFEEALDALEWNEGYAGIGFVFAAGGGIFGFDADHQRDPQTGALTPTAQAWLDQLQTFTEISPSGAGVHAIGYGELPGPGRKQAPFEVYGEGRYFTITGNRLDAYPATLTQVNGALTDLYQTLSPAKADRARAEDLPAVGTTILTDDEVLAIANAAKNGAAFRNLWAGDTRAYDGDDSGADLALCNHLAFYCRHDVAQMDRLFRTSGLLRDKWDERRGASTYGERTMAEAIAGTPEVYEGPRKVRVRRRVDTTTGEVFDTEEGEEDGEEDDDDSPPPAYDPHLTDLGNALRLAHLYGADLRYVSEWGWLGWNGRHWQMDATGVAERFARRVVSDLYREARALRKQKLTKTAAAMTKWAFTSEGSSRLDAMVHQAQFAPEIVGRPDQFDADPWLLTCANGTIDLRTGALRESAREDYATRASPVTYDPAAAAPTWDAFLAKILPDATVRAFVQRFAGYTLTGSTDEQCLAFLYGPGGNGKSTLLGMLQRVLGEFATQTPAETLMVKQQTGGIPNDIAALAGRRMVTTIEVENGKRLAESLIKSLTGQDLITARFLRREFFTFRPAFKVWLAANHKPVIRGTDHAIWRRIHLIPFTVQITEAERKADPDFLTRLTGELPGILRWCVEGCRAWQREGLDPPEAVRLATAAYRAEMDMLSPFLDECCELGRRKEVHAGAIYQSYMAWCEQNGYEIMRQRTFGSLLSEHGFERARGTANAHIWRGLTLLSTAPKPAGMVTVQNAHQSK